MANVNRYIKARRGQGRSGERLYLQVPVPKDLRERFGRACVERCLRTDSLKVARIRRDAMLPEIKAMFDRARQEPKLEDVLSAVRREEMARAQIEWTELIADRGLAAARDLFGLLDEDDAVWPRRARQTALRHGLSPAGQVADILFEAHTDGAELALDGRQATIAPPRPMTSGDLASPVPVQTVTQFRDLLAKWERERRPAGRTVLDFKRAMRRLGEHVGHEDAARLSRDDIAEFRDAALERGTWKTAWNALCAVKAVLNVGVRGGRLAVNPASGVAMRKVPGPRRLPFDDAEAALILTAARHQRGGRRWVPWLLACTGARLEEVCQAHVSDIRQCVPAGPGAPAQAGSVPGAEGAIWYLDINEDGHGKALKNAGSARKVPLHPALIDEGFLDYVADIGRGPLFPDLKPDCFGRRGGTATKVLGRALRKLGITDPRKVAGHSWRHRFKDLCRGAGIEKAVHDALTGHSSHDVSDGYGLGYPLPVLAAAIAKLPLKVE